jgi:hypothetical protein
MLIIMSPSLCIQPPVSVPISRPTDAACDGFLFSIYMCITLHVSSVKCSSSGVPHRTYSLQFLCLCLSVALSCKKLSYKKLYMFRTSSAHHQESLTVHTASSFCVCVCLWHCLVRNFLTREFLTRQCRRQTQTQKLEAVCTVRDS